MEKVDISVLKREELKSGKVGRLRRDNFVPAVVYGKGVNIPLKILDKELRKLHRINFSESALVQLHISDNGSSETVIPSIIREVQYDPLTERVIHIDFMQVSLEEKIRVHIPIVLSGEALGIKEGGVLEQILRDIEVEAKFTDIPEKLVVDVSNLHIGQSIHVSEIKVPPEVTLVTDPGEVIATVVKIVEEVETPVEEGQPSEPEVIKEKPKEEQAEEKEK